MSNVQDIAKFTPARIHRKYTCALCEKEKSGAGFNRDERGAYKSVCKKCEPSNAVLAVGTRATVTSIGEDLVNVIRATENVEARKLLKQSLELILNAEVKIRMENL